MHQTSGRWKLGLLLSLLTAILWGLLPIALKGLLQYMDSVTITWLRFLIAALLLGAFLKHKKQLPDLSLLSSKSIAILMVIAVIGLTANYITYMYGLSMITPESGQVVIQLAPLLLLLGGLFFFKESFSLRQWFGLGLFLTGLALFFNQRMDELLQAQGDYFNGVILIIIAAVLWAAYALAQKQLLKVYSSEAIMYFIYIAGIVIFLPGSTPQVISSLDAVGWALLLFCGLNTLVAYGAFAEALEHWEASRVSAVLAITPLLTLLFMQITNVFYPDYLEPEPINSLSMIGAVVLVIGSMMTAIANNKKKSS
ncbi:DMT family transporter [Pleionea sp. CnH1-48]|uniref:DMT family transporter n=1 Tax=Pleionea sp. CnH1-48 TaxID=2954494 RepID=UPI0020969960|nr:DMT family transporter [Pleionea sp. CnH1-48]MCO7223962.1 DMT family transporter [Pleionea sp. CnH1-48]